MESNIDISDQVYIDEFISRHQAGISNLHSKYIGQSDYLALSAFNSQIKPELLIGYQTYLNKQYPIEEIDNYLFYIVNSICKKLSHPIKKKTEYICPACSYFNIVSVIYLSNQILKCSECRSKINDPDPEKNNLYQTFFIHSKSGYRCPNCKRFIPQPSFGATHIVCPFLDCWYVGNSGDLKKMHHPTIKTIPEKIVADDQIIIIDDQPNVLTQLENEEELTNKVQVIKSVIENQYNCLAYGSVDFTIKQKQLIYQSFQHYLDHFPQEMTEYLLSKSRYDGFQHKIFQKFVSLLEQELPFYIRKAKKRYVVDSLLSPYLSIFDGISKFEGVVNSNLEVKNNTQEFYIGGRKASYTKPYYIGKLLNVIDTQSKDQLLDRVKEYSFSKIKLTNTLPNTSVIITHLRIPPHYQMGAMAHINRIRKKIIDRTNYILSQNNIA